VSDSVVDRTTFAADVVAGDFRVFHNLPNEMARWASNSPDVQIDAEGMATVLGNTTAELTIPTRSGARFGISKKVKLAATTPTTYRDAFVSFVAGSLAAHMQNQVESRLIGTPAATVNMWQFHPQLSYYADADRTTRNPSCWCSGIDLTFCNTRRTGGGGRLSLIAPDLAVSATHFTSGMESHTFYWRGTDGVEHGRTIAARYTQPATDITIFRLSSPLPATVIPVKVAPANFKSFFQRDEIYTVKSENKYTNTGTWKSGKVVLVQDYKAVPVVGSAVTGFTARTDGWRGLGANGLSEYAVSGDSSSPLGVIINGGFVLLGTLLWPSAAKIELGLLDFPAIKTALGASGTVQFANLSTFPTY
jgi:hypothetical protein